MLFKLYKLTKYGRAINPRQVKVWKERSRGLTE